MLRMHKIRFSPELHPRPHWGSSQCSPRPLSRLSPFLTLRHLWCLVLSAYGAST